MPKGWKNVLVKDVPSGQSYKQSDNYKGKGGYGVTYAASKAPSQGKVSYPGGNGHVVSKVKK